MKLLVKTGLYYLTMSIPILIFSGFLCYYMITYEVISSNDELLTNRKEQVMKHLVHNDTIVLNLITQSGEAEIRKLTSAEKTRDVFSDTLIYDKNEREMAPQRLLTSVLQIGGINYKIKIWRSTLEYDELYAGITMSLVIVLIFMALASMLMNFWISKTLWKPFYKTVANVKSFRAIDSKVPGFLNTSVTEFSDLNDSIRDMMEKMISDFNSQKKFTENASHEIQTPLAVIKTKVDLLIQSKNLGESEAGLIMSIEDACMKLVRMNQSLLLLTKIENRQFAALEKVSLQEIVKTSLRLFEGRIDDIQNDVDIKMKSDFWVFINKDLCLILVNNLVQNALRHKSENGKIEILLDAGSLTISNPGLAPLPDNIFERFNKDSFSAESMGLGLAIAREIAETGGLTLTYTFLAKRHLFILSEGLK